MKAVLAGALTVLVGAGCAATTLPDEAKAKSYEPVMWVSPQKSGLQVIVQEDHSAPVVTTVSAFGVGGSGDPKGVEGLAHFIEHLAFRSHPGGGNQQFWDYLKRMGGDFNAFTNNEMTVYFNTAHKDNLEMMLQLEAWRLARTIDGVTEQVFTTEREVVRNELRQRGETTVGSKQFDLVFQALFPPGHPLSRPVVGTHESLTAATLEHARKFVKDYYRPDNCVMVIIGDVDTDRIKQLLGQWPPEILFAPGGGPEGPTLPPGPRLAQRKAPEVPPPQKTELQRHKGPVTQPELLVAWSLPPGYRGKDGVARFAASRLNLALGELDVREDDDIEGVGAFPETLADGSVMVLQADLKPGADPEKARKRLLDILVNAWSTDLGRAVTEASRWGSATSMVLGAADPAGRAVQLAEYMIATGRNQYFKDNFDELAAIKPSEVAEFAFKWLTRDRAVSVYFEPETDDIPRLLGGGGGGGASPGGGGNEHNVGRDTIGQTQELSSEKLLQMVRSPQLAKIPHHKLANGLEVYAVSRPGAPVAQIQLGLRGGNATTRPVGAASLAMAVARPRCNESGSLGPVGGRIGTATGATSSTSSVTVLSGNLPNAMAVLADNVRCREVDDESFLFLPRFLDTQSKVFKRSEKRPEFIAGRKFFGELYPNHPYGEGPFVDPAMLKSMRLQDAQAFVQSHLRPDNGAAVVYGDIEPSEVWSLADKYLTRWTAGAGGGSMMPPPTPPGPSTRKIYLVDRPKATQATVTMGCRLTDLVPDNMPAYDVLEAAANERAWYLREQWGATYGVNAQVSTQVGNASHLLFSGAVVNPQVGKSISRLLDVIRELGSGSLDERLFLTSRWDTGRKFMAGFASAGAQANAILSALNHNWPLEVWDNYPQNLARTTRDSFKEIMGPCVGKEVVAIVGDASDLRPQLEKEGLKLEGN